MELCVIIREPPTGGAPRPFILYYETSDGTASKKFYTRMRVEMNVIALVFSVASEDYYSANGTLMFAIGESRKCHNVTIKNDDICEGLEREYFTSSLQLVEGKPVIIVDPPETRVLIDDREDCSKCCFILHV